MRLCRTLSFKNILIQSTWQNLYLYLTGPSPTMIFPRPHGSWWCTRKWKVFSHFHHHYWPFPMSINKFRFFWCRCWCRAVHLRPSHPVSLLCVISWDIVRLESSFAGNGLAVAEMTLIDEWLLQSWLWLTNDKFDKITTLESTQHNRIDLDWIDLLNLISRVKHPKQRNLLTNTFEGVWRGQRNRCRLIKGSSPPPSPRMRNNNGAVF